MRPQFKDSDRRGREGQGPKEDRPPEKDRLPIPPSHSRSEEVAAAMIASSIDLLSLRSGSHISLRDIARHAGLQHSDIHRHIGNKRNLIKAVLDKVVERELSILHDAGPLSMRERLYLTNEGSLLGQVLLWAALEGLDPADLMDGPLPSMKEGAVYAARRRAETGRSGPEVDARIVVAAITAIMMSWQTAAPMLLRAAGLDEEDPATVREGIGRVIAVVNGLAVPPAGVGEGSSAAADQSSPDDGS